MAAATCNADPDLVGILSYCGDVLDIALNWTLCVVTAASLAAWQSTIDARVWRWSWVGVVAFLFAFQISLCVGVKCTGVSVVWSALVAYNGAAIAVVYRTGGRPPTRTALGMLVASVLCSAGAWAYYAVTADALTSIAHGCAVVLGLIMGVAFSVTYVQVHQGKVSPLSEPLGRTSGDQDPGYGTGTAAPSRRPAPVARAARPERRARPVYQDPEPSPADIAGGRSVVSEVMRGDYDGSARSRARR